MSFSLEDRYHNRATMVHGLDPRVKLIVALLFVVLVNLVPVGHWWTFFWLWLVILLISSFSRLSLLYTAKRSLFATPFVLAALSIPFTTPGSPILTVPWVGWVITDTGLQLLLSIFCRFWLAVQMAVLLRAVTSIPDLLWALRSLHMPGVLVSVIGVMYRYLRVLGSEAARMSRARAARCCTVHGKTRPGLVWRGRVTGAMIGSLFLRAVSRSERIHLAMLSRAYDGTPRSLGSFRMVYADWCVLVGSLFLVLIGSSWVLL